MDERNQVMADIASNITDYQRAQQQLSLFTTGILPQARQTVQSMLAGYQVSEVDFLNLVRSQVTLLNYELQYWKSLTESYQALARLQASIGKESIYE
jgi:outer membrane protein TolC